MPVVNAKAALVISIASAAVAVAIVSVDLAFTVTSHIDVRTNDGWETVASDPFQGNPRSFGFGPGCVAPDLRVRVDNNRPIPASIDVLVRYNNPENGTTTKVYEETWRLSAFEERTFEFVIPQSAFPATNENRPVAQVYIEAFLAADYALGVCVAKGGTA
jgi:hypothetical protein